MLLADFQHTILVQQVLAIQRREILRVDYKPVRVARDNALVIADRRAVR